MTGTNILHKITRVQCFYFVNVLYYCFYSVF